MNSPVPDWGEDPADNEFPREYLSLIFHLKEKNQLVQISKKANTPIWLKKSMYEKLQTKIQFELQPIDEEQLFKVYEDF